MRRAVPAVLIGAGCAVMLQLLDLASGAFSTVLWQRLPRVFGADSGTPWWIVAVLTATGAAIGAVVWLVPGHGGYDSAVTELNGPFPRLVALPSLALVVVLALAGGVSLGPENPIIAINAALSIAVVGRLVKSASREAVAALAVAGTIGALFSTPVAAALMFTGVVAAVKAPGALWDKLFLPVAAAGAGSVVMHLMGGQALAFALPAVGTLKPVYLLTGLIVAVGSALIGVAAAWLLPRLHRLFHALRNPLVFTTAGGALLGVLAVAGGPLTMFKGLEQTGELLTHAQQWSPGQLALFAGVRLAAMLIAAASGFRGGRIFPIVFAGAALGLLGSAVIPGTPVALGVACAVLGVTLVATRDGWMAMFLGVALVGDISLLPLLCLVVLPVWLVVTRAPELTVHEPTAVPAGARRT